MPYIPKIEVFKLILKNKKLAKDKITFRELFRAKTAYYHDYDPKPQNNNDIFKNNFDKLVNAINFEKYNVDQKNKRCFTVLKVVNEDNKEETKMDLYSEAEVVTGILQGGIYGLMRTIGNIDNTSKQEKLQKDNSVDDLYYFLLYTPIDHCEGLLIIQGSTDFKISGVVKQYFQKYFSTGIDWKSEFETYIPKFHRKKYEDDAKFSTITFTSGWTVDGKSYEEDKPNKHTLQVKIEISDTSKEKSNVSLIKKIREWVGESKFALSGKEVTTLKEFEEATLKVLSRGREMTFDYDSETEKVAPSILLQEGEFVNEDSSLNFKKIDEYCRTLLENVKKEFLP